MSLNISNKIGELLIDKNVKNQGLMYGKIGISIFFYNLARLSTEEKYAKYADKLIDDLFKELTTEINFKDGIVGIV